MEGYTSTSASLPFKNIDPRSREQRFQANSKDHLEKARIAARHKGGSVVYNPLQPVTSSPQYLDEHSRFTAKDAASAEHERKLKLLADKEASYERKRADRYYSEQERWTRQEQQNQKHENVLTYKRDNNVGAARRNKSSEHYDIVTLNYTTTPEGQALRHKDETTMYKAQLRAQTLYSKSHSVTHNIITGEPLRPPPAPQRPLAPWEK